MNKPTLFRHPFGRLAALDDTTTIELMRLLTEGAITLHPDPGTTRADIDLFIQGYFFLPPSPQRTLALLACNAAPHVAIATGHITPYAEASAYRPPAWAMTANPAVTPE